MKRLILISAIFFIGSISCASSNVDPGYSGPTGLSETLVGVFFNETGISFQVQSNGCESSKENFDLVIMEPYPVQLDLIRKTPDFDQLCPEVIRVYGDIITYTYDELGFNSAFRINNRIEAGIPAF